MVDPIANKTPLKPVDFDAEQELASPSKTGASKFDKVRTRLQEEQAGPAEIPPEIQQISLEQRKMLETDLSKRLEKGGPNSAHELFAVDMTRAKQRVEHLTSRVNALPKMPAFEPLRNRLLSLDAQYQSTGQLVSSIKGSEDPGELMKVQIQMYQLTENLELMSKVVEQVTSGVKSILQTQL